MQNKAVPVSGSNLLHEIIIIIVPLKATVWREIFEGINFRCFRGSAPNREICYLENNE